MSVSFESRQSECWPARSRGGRFEESDEEGRLGAGRKTGEVPADREQKKVNAELHPDTRFIWNSAVNQ